MTEPWINSIHGWDGLPTALLRTSMTSAGEIPASPAVIQALEDTCSG